MDDHLPDDDDLLFASILVRDPAMPDPRAVEQAARDLGMALSHVPSRSTDDGPTFETDRGASVVIGAQPGGDFLVGVALPGVNSPPREVLESAAATLTVSVEGLRGSERERDTELARIAAAVARCAPSISVQLRTGTHHEASLFLKMIEYTRDGSPLPPEIAIDVTCTPEGEDRLGLLTENMERYGREEIYVTCLPDQRRDALRLVLLLARWLLTDLEKELPTGDTVGRSPEERLIVQRVPDPTGRGEDVVRIDL